MKRLAFAAATCAALLLGGAACADVFTGQFSLGSGEFTIPLSPESRPVRFRLAADLTDVALNPVVEVTAYDIETIDMGPGQPRSVSSFEFPLNHFLPVTPTGFDQTITADPNFGCDPFQGPLFACSGQIFRFFDMTWDNTGAAPVDWALSITPVPDPPAWAVTLLGFAIVGAGLRRLGPARASVRA